ncbi:hypothetical protein CC85DRAFT_287897 [Cutaneotrichosporon oleaginosum]|uniref:Glucosidase 2 subunit beta n=1 Tax=Cutaneotrichosporon oleaginosum TaxID=879819 RepID=A0A0J0XG43_9TREE|nr:uncharacterized protein CC85DRAFT_287897 [Cutaneotrichosporon oleaginosum]KLT40016.1 hypothetical protein CC85DRAFT_287897 [Cutaneotrichosporon oleaginosum]TXT13842.1 hypothetical protein COLE_00035 [Cutaneotrichosporon oleaginosum]
MKGLALAALLPALVAAEHIRGVDPAFEDKYAPSLADFTCLDGSKTIPMSAVNDDYCDCPDGSDEPGTSACEGRPHAYFYCRNDGHIPARILSSRVNDGICDDACCDGSDEWATGACPNRCADIARAHKERIEREGKIRRTGAKIRGTYVAFAQKEKKRLQDEIAAKRVEVRERERQVAEAKAALENAEAQSRDDLERKKSSPLYKALEEHREAVKRLRDQLRATQDDLGTVLGILDELAKGYNPNGQDMAVKAAVVGYRELIGDAEPEGEETPEAKLHTVRAPDEHLSGFDVERVVNVDLESLLVDEAADDDDDGLLYRLEEYIPDSLYEYYYSAREAFVGALTSMGVLKKDVVAHDGPHVSAARERYNAAERELNAVRSAISGAEETLEQIGNRHWFGPEGEWKKLDGTCVDTVAGDYTYELCFFGKATQKSNKDHSSNNLGHFVEWNPAAKPGEYAYYTKMAYRNGAKCWNGPMRSVNVELECGKENALLAITEPEKCEYNFKVTSPALCWPLEDAGKPVVKEDVVSEAAKDEL